MYTLPLERARRWADRQTHSRQPSQVFVLRGACAKRGRSKGGGCITLVIRRLISRGESSLPHLCLHQVPVTCARCHPSLPHPYRPSYLFLPTLALFLFPTLPSVIPGTLTRIPLPIYPSPFHSIDRDPQPSLALTGIRTSQRTESDISADRHTQSFSPTTPSPQNPNTHLKTRTPGGLKTHSLPHHCPGVATLFTTYLGEAQTNEKWMTKHRQDRSLPLPSMTLSNRLHIQSSVH
jgi:hypothetical protein